MAGYFYTSILYSPQVRLFKICIWYENQCFFIILQDSPSIGASEPDDSVSISSQVYQYQNLLPLKVSRCLHGPLPYLIILSSTASSQYILIICVV